jgi:hypothetical protein
MEDTFNRLQKLNLLKFLPKVKEEVKDRLSKATVNSVIAQ